MIAAKTLRQYLQECDEVLNSHDRNRAHELVNRIVAVFDTEIKEIRQGLETYSSVPILIGTMSDYEAPDQIDYIHDVILLRAKLQKELDKVEPITKAETRIKAPKIFISHNSKDKDYVELFVDLLEDIGFTEDQIFCSSVDGYGVPLDENIFDYLKRQFESFDLHVIYILSRNYYQSVASLNEMGAAWIMKTRYTNILLPGFDYSSIVGVIDRDKNSPKLDANNSKELLTELKDSLNVEFNLHPISSVRWEKKRNEFLDSIMNLYTKYSINSEKPDSALLPQNGGNALLEGMKLSHEAMILLAYASKDPNGQIKYMQTLGGVSLETGKWDFISDTSNPRKVATWKSALEELVGLHFVDAAGYKSEIFNVTCRGFEVADAVIESNDIDVEQAPDIYLEDR